MDKNKFGPVVNTFNNLTTQRKIILAAALVITVVLIGSLVVMLNEPNYSTLYSNLSEEDASKVIDMLASGKIQYKIDDNGKTIKVPKEKVYETRLSLAGKGIPSSGMIGYEIFDKTTMGMSEFMQKLNYKRALEGELARTISQQEGVDGVRVHIVMPQKSVFKDEEKLPTASIVLKLKSNFSITKSNIAAIINLVSSSVEGLQPNKVTLIDTQGRLLSKETADDLFGGSSSKQYEIKQSVESYLAAKAQNILDNVLGYGNAMVQINADLNFDQVEKTMELYDPETQVAISEQNIKTENSGNKTGDSSVQTSQNSTVNYEINKTVQRVVEGMGNIKRLSIAAVINDSPKEVKKGDAVETVFEPRTKDQLDKLENIVKNAVGFDDKRIDQFSIVNIPFETKPIEEIKMEETSVFSNPDKWINVLLTILAIGASLFILKGLMNKLKNEKIFVGAVSNEDGTSYDSFLPSSKGTKANLPGAKRPRSPMIDVGDLEDELSDEAVSKKVQHEKITNYVSKNPTDTAKLINAWLHQDEE